MDYEQVSISLKAMSDPNRIKIIDLLSNGELCACEVLTHFNFTQPTLSHHMKVLEKAKIISVNKKGKWYHYTLRDEFVSGFMKNMHQLLEKGIN